MSPLTAARVQMELSLGFHMLFAGVGMAMPVMLASAVTPGLLGMCLGAARTFAGVLVTWLIAGVVSLLLLLAAKSEAPHLWTGLTKAPEILFLFAGVLLAPGSAFALWRGRFPAARFLGAGQVVVLLLGWAVAQWPYLIYPDLTVTAAAAPRATLAFTAATVPVGLALLVPSLWFLFSVFKGRAPQQTLHS
jgi:cytochrome bd-type quinol oxidase subunit 2